MTPRPFAIRTIDLKASTTVGMAEAPAGIQVVDAFHQEKHIRGIRRKDARQSRKPCCHALAADTFVKHADRRHLSDVALASRFCSLNGYDAGGTRYERVGRQRDRAFRDAVAERDEPFD